MTSSPSPSQHQQASSPFTSHLSRPFSPLHDPSSHRNHINSNSSQHCHQQSSTHSLGTKKKLIIKPFVKKPTLPDSFEENTLASLSDAIDCVFQTKPSRLSQEELYRASESLCLHKKAEELFLRVQMQCDGHTRETLQQLAKRCQSMEDVAALQAMANSWQTHCTHIQTLRSIFLYLDRTYVLHTTSLPFHSLWDMGLQSFCQHLTEYEGGQLDRRTRYSILHLIERERQGEVVSRTLLRTLIYMYVALKCYSQLQHDLLSATDVFYRAEAERLLSSSPLPDYLHQVQSRIAQEEDRLQAYIHPSTGPALMLLIDNRMVADHCEGMIAKGFNVLLKEKRAADLALMHMLYARIKKMELLKTSFGEYVKNTGTAIMTGDLAKEATMIADLLSFKKDLDNLLAQAFSPSFSEFLQAMKSAFESFLNLIHNKPAELIAKYLDRMLKAGGTRGATLEELDVEFDRVMFLFRYIQSKDVFSAFYSKDLARRLLLNTSASVDAEKASIAKLKQECGASFTNKLEGMFKDMELTKDLQEQFDSHLKKLSNAPEMEISVYVLTQGSWPAYPTLDFVLPLQVVALQDEFKRFYLNQHSGRRLQFQNSLATAVLRANLPRGRKEFQVNAMQCAVLLCFNPAGVQTEPPALSFRTLSELTRMEDGELKRTLQSLCLHDTIRVLTKEPRSRTINETDVFKVDLTFRSQLFRIKLPSLANRESKEEQTATTNKVFEDRQYAIDAAIVRIMKARKTLTHAELMAETLSVFATKFPIKPADVKKCISTLIEREYLERDAEDSQRYSYLA